MKFPLHLLLAFVALAPATTVWAWDDPDEGSLITRRFTPMELGISHATVAFCMAPNGDVFIGSDRVLLTRSVWKSEVLASPPAIEYRALAATSGGRLWAGGVGELGFFQPNQNGDYIYTSLTQAYAQSRDAELPGVMLAVKAVGEDRAIFIGLRGVHYWNGKEFQHWIISSHTPLRALRPASDLLWIYQKGSGMFSVDANGIHLLKSETELPGQPEWVLTAPGSSGLTQRETDCLLGTPTGIFKHESGQWQRLPEVSANIDPASITTVLSLTKDLYALGTKQRGVTVINQKGKIVRQIEGFSALRENQVNTLGLGLNGELWVGSNAGWTRILSPRINSVLPLPGAPTGNGIWGLARHRNTIYVTTGDAVSVVRPSDHPDKPAQLAPLPNAPSSTWTLSSLGNLLMAGGSSGVWGWDGYNWTQEAIAEDNVFFSLASFHRPGRLFYVDGSTLKFLSKAPSEYADPKAQFFLGSPANSLIEDEQGNIWVTTNQARVFCFRQTETSFELVTQFQPSDLPGTTSRAMLATAGRRVALFTDNAILAFNRESGKFSPIPTFAGFYGVTAAQVDDQQKNVWIVERRGSQLGLYTPQMTALAECDDAGVWHHSVLAAGQPVTPLGRNAIVLSPGYASVWVGGLQQLARIGPDALVPPSPPPSARLLSVSIFGSSSELARPGNPSGMLVQPTTARIPLTGSTILPADTERIRFEMAAVGRLDGNDNSFQSQLVGLEKEWAAPVTGFREFTGLAPGRYEFRFRLMDRYGQVGEPLSYSFQRQAMWYYRWPALLGYVLVGALLLIGCVRWNLRRLRVQNDRLNRMVGERTRELAMANSEKMDFLASISHEIRNPLNGITGLVSLLNNSSLAPHEQEMARSLAACARSLRRVFDEVLGFSRLEEGRVAVKEEAFRLPALLEDMVSLFSTEAALRHCSLELHCPSSLPLLLGDAEKISTIISNFVSNALKYAPGAPVQVEASAEIDDAGYAAVKIQVHDQGPGVPVEEQELIFRKFVRGINAEMNRELGAGLGLATCQALAKLMGGSVGIESRAGGGSTFYFLIVLPVGPASVYEEAHDTATRIERIPVDQGAKSRALVIEDQQYNQLIARNILKRLSYTVDIAANATEVQTRLSEGRYALILVDWDIPGAKGDEIVRLIRARPNGWAATILMVTAHDEDHVRERGLQAGMDGFLVKPLEEEILLRALRSVQTLTSIPPIVSRLADAPPDFSIFAYLGHNDQEETLAVAREYIEQLEVELTALAESERANNPTSLASHAHRLRSHAAVVHCRPLGEAARQLQEQASEGASPLVSPLCARIRECADALREQLQLYIQTQPTH